MRSLVRAALVASAIAVPATYSAPPASAALVCLYWASFQVTPGPPAVYVPLPTGADVGCTVQTSVRYVEQVQEIIEEIEIEDIEIE